MADNEKQLQIRLDLKDDASSKFKDIGTKIKDAFSKISVASSAAIAGISAFAIKSVKDYGALAEEVDNLSKSTGIGVAQIAAMKLAADQTSVPLETMTTGVKKLQINMELMKEGGLKAQGVFKDLHLKFSEINKLPVEQQLFEIGNAISNIKDPAERTTIAVKLFGKAGTDLLPLFGKGTASMQDWIDKADELGVSMDEVGVAKAKAADDAFDDYESTMKGLTQTLAREFLPVVVDIINKITPIINGVGIWISNNQALAEKLAMVGGALLAVGAALGPITAAIKVIGIAIGLLTSPIGLVIVAITSLVGAFTYLYTNNKEFADKVNALWTSIKEFFNQTIASIVSFFKQLWVDMQRIWGDIKSVTTTAFNAISSAFQIFADFMRPLWNAFWGFLKDAVLPILTAIGDLFKALWNTIGGAFNAAIGWIKPLWNDFWNKTKDDVSHATGPIIEFVTEMKKEINAIFNAISDVVGPLWGKMWDGIKAYAVEARDFIVQVIGTITGNLQEIPKTISSITNTVKDFANGKSIGKDLLNIASSVLDNSIGLKKAPIPESLKSQMGPMQQFANGGRPKVGSASIVGENGPEQFIPDVSGNIIPNNKLGGTTVINNISGNSFLDHNAARKLGNLLFNELRLQTRI